MPRGRTETGKSVLFPRGLPGARFSSRLPRRPPGGSTFGSPVYKVSGGLHGVGLFKPDGTLVVVREDVGRHNALDKVVGSQVIARALPLHDRILMVSGRVSFEIVQKAAVAGVPIICAVSAPSSLAIDAAERLGVTLIGFLRGDGFNVYSHDGRIDLEDLRTGQALTTVRPATPSRR